MRDPTILLDPTSERLAAMRERIAPPASLEGLTVGLLDISKPRGDRFLDRMEARFAEKGIRTLRFRKPTVAKQMPAEIAADIAEHCDIVVEALAD